MGVFMTISGAIAMLGAYATVIGLIILVVKTIRDN